MVRMVELFQSEASIMVNTQLIISTLEDNVEKQRSSHAVNDVEEIGCVLRMPAISMLAYALRSQVLIVTCP